MKPEIKYLQNFVIDLHLFIPVVRLAICLLLFLSILISLILFLNLSLSPDYLFPPTFYQGGIMTGNQGIRKSGSSEIINLKRNNL